MQSEKWQQVSQIFERALALEADERAAYLENQDESLRREVELLIQSHQKASAENFMSGHAVENVASLLNANEQEADDGQEQLAEGQELGHYRVIKRIGAGGMGEVYLAKDSRLDRTVALKILPADIASDQRRMVRFKQEARLVSSLNQPNILTIFEFGEVDSLQFIATEFVDGVTLRQYLRKSQLSLQEVIDIAIQVTAALDAAHEAKIVHRDIKPENIMIRGRDGVVKVLDFGLAKLTEKKTASGLATDTEAPTEVLLKTMPGVLMGTVNYMSPEQARGLPVDARTDIWSMGAVLYEMAAGYAPFSGQTSSHIIVDILEKEPPTPLGLPAELDRIIRKTLAKKPEDRYQTTRDLLIDLKNLRKRLELDAELVRTGPPSPSETPAAVMQTRSPGSRVLVPMLISAAVVGLLVLGFTVWSSSRPNILPPAPAAAPDIQRQLNYWMTVQKYRDGNPYEDPFRMTGEMLFEKDYRVQLNVSSPQAGYLYILNEGPSAGQSLSILFPSPTANSGSPRLVENQQVKIPEDGGFQFDAQQGTEKVWLVFSPTAVSELEAVKGFANKRDKGEITDPDLNKAAKAFIETNSAPKPGVEKNDDRKETSVRSSGNVIVHLIKLEHH
ncbi:MAG TPA: protein kinase [Pyrinomonadaceae bacterium]|nr:protein kinase [Pyrinomonadaceae bacterium]